MKNLALIASVIAFGALGIAGTALAKPTGMTQAEYRALMLRSEGLNAKYGVKPLPPVTLEQGLNQRLTVSKPSAPQGMTAAEYRALMLRSEGLDRKYGLGISSLTLERGTNERFVSGNPTKDELVTTSPIDTSTGSAWDDAGIGAGVVLAAIALLGSLFLVRNHGQVRTS